MSKILFIEDEVSLQTTLGGALKEAGFEIENAYDGETGLKTAQTSKPDLILLDLILPKMDGFQVLRDLKSGAGTKDIPVIVLTNLESADDVGKVIALGATTYLVKSNYELGDIVVKIKEVLKK
ncbi:MAG: response regulator [Patescibacteria group bacterium]